ncbi:MAG: hypothetical protein WD844_15080 [Thermoleophilaceae bacterium]
MKKADFNAEEWTTVLQGPPMAGLRVMAAERGGTLRESLSMAKAYTETREGQGTSELLDEIVSSRPDVDPAALGSGSADELARNSMQRLREAVEVLESKAPAEEVDAYRQFVQQLAERVASSHKEGGFLGIGGKPVSESEQAALDEIAGVLRAAGS